MSADAARRPLAVSVTPWTYRLLSLCAPVALFLPSTIPALAVLWTVLLGGSWFLGRRNLDRIDVEIPGSAVAFAWEAFPLTLRIHNRSPRWVARDLLFRHSLESRRKRPWFEARPRLAAASGCLLRPRMRMPHRGRFTRYHLTVASTFPFGLLRWRLDLTRPVDLLALPRLGEIRSTAQLLPEPGLGDLGRPRRAAGEGEFFGLLEWRPGLSQRQICWKATARRGRLMIRQTQRRERPAVRVVLHLARPASPHGQQHADFERAVSLTATLLEYLLRRRQPAELTLAGRRLRTWRPRPDRNGLNTVLATLAEVEAEGGAPLRIPQRGQRGEAVVFITCSGLTSRDPDPRVRVVDARDERAIARWFREERVLPHRTRLAEPA